MHSVNTHIELQTSLHCRQMMTCQVSYTLDHSEVSPPRHVVYQPTLSQFDSDKLQQVLIDIQSHRTKLKTHWEDMQHSTAKADVVIRQVLRQSQTPECYSLAFADSVVQVWEPLRAYGLRDKWYQVAVNVYHRESMAVCGALWSWIDIEIVSMTAKMMTHPGALSCL